MMTHEQQVSVVDDDAAARESVAALVESMGIRANAYSSAEEFLSAFDAEQTGCLVADVRLRGMSGLELLEVISVKSRHLPVLIITAFADVPLTVRAMSLGAVTVLQKPYRDQELWDSISKALTFNDRRRKDDAHLRGIQVRMESMNAAERHVLVLILAGRTNKGIARELHCGLRTVEARRHSIMTKLGAPSLADLVRIVWETRSLAARNWRTCGSPQFFAEEHIDHLLVADRYSETVFGSRGDAGALSDGRSVRGAGERRAPCV